jgi:competence protein ComGC
MKTIDSIIVISILALFFIPAVVELAGFQKARG